MEVVPYKEEKATKKEQVARMFDAISPKYDFLNHILSLGIDKGWRKKAIHCLRERAPKTILDVATGTGDFAIQAMDLKPEKVFGIDISTGMLRLGKEKMEKLGLAGKIELLKGDSENIPFSENKFDAVTVAFGVRNFENLEKGLSEIYRVLKPEGMAVILEFSKPKGFFFSWIFNFYFKNILPFVGRWISKEKVAYTYLPESVAAFPYGKEFIEILKKTGFKETSCTPLTFGISTLYLGVK